MPEAVRKTITERLLRNASSERFRGFTLLSALAFATLAAPGARAADKAADSAPAAAPPFAWDGFYVGGHLGYAGGRSNWSGPDIAGSSSIAKPIDTFTEAGSFIGGFQGGYNLLLPSHVLLGVEADFTFPAYPDLSGQSTGATANFISPSLGPATYMEAMQASGTARGRVGYVFNDWLLYATGGFAWARDQQTLTQISSGTTDAPFLWRWGWAVGAGVEVPLIPNWTAKLEYLYSNFGAKSVGFPSNNEVFRSDFALQTVRLGLNYHFGDFAAAAPSGASRGAAGRMDAGGRRPRQFPQPGHLRRPRLSQNPRDLERAEQSAARGRLPTDQRRHALRWPAPLAGRGALGQPGNRPGLRPRQHPRGGRLPERGSLQTRRSLSLYARAALFPAPDREPRRRREEGGGGHQSVRGNGDGKSPRLHHRQIRCRRYFRHQQIRQQSQERLPELVGDQRRHVRLRRRRLGVHLWRGGGVVSGSLDRARRDFRPLGDAHGRGAQWARPMASTPI